MGSGILGLGIYDSRIEGLVFRVFVLGSPTALGNPRIAVV